MNDYLVFPNGLINYSSHLIHARIFNQINPNKDLILDMRKVVLREGKRLCIPIPQQTNISNNKEAKNSSRGTRTIFSGSYGFYRFHRTIDSKAGR